MRCCARRVEWHQGELLAASRSAASPYSALLSIATKRRTYSNRPEWGSCRAETGCGSSFLRPEKHYCYDKAVRPAGIHVAEASEAGVAPSKGQIGAIPGDRRRSRLSREGRLRIIAALGAMDGKFRFSSRSPNPAGLAHETCYGPWPVKAR